MAFLKLTGIQVDVAEPNRPEVERIGDEGRAFSGKLISGYRAKKLPWHIRTVPMLQADAHALRQLVEGEGYSFSYDTDLYPDLKGALTVTGSGLFVAGKYGNALSTYQSITYAAGAGSAWTISGWVFKPSVGLWHHFIRLSSGAKYKDGVSTADDPLMNVSGANLVLSPEVTAGGAGAWAPFTVYNPGDKVLESGVVFVQVDGTNGGNNVEPPWSTALGAEVEEDGPGSFGGPWIWYGSNTGFDDVVFLPYQIPDSWVADFYAEMSARAFTPLPRLRVTGDAVAALPGAVLTAEGRTREAPVLQAVLGGALQDNIEVLDFDLMEV